jgi:shikimate kinase
MSRSRQLVKRVLQRLDPRLRRAFVEALEDAAPLPPCPGRLVLVGQRAAGKSSLLPVLAASLELPAIDLDLVLERTSGRSLKDWVRDDPAGFRAAERRAFDGHPARTIIAVGGGFLIHHADALAHDTPVWVPVTFETYCERLRADLTRPRLRPELPLEEELRLIFHQRETALRRARTVPLSAVVRTLIATEEALACSAS